MVIVHTLNSICWQERYYSISEDEYKWFDSDIDKLNHLADELYHSGVSNSRFMFSERNIENNSFQTKLINKVLSQRDLRKNP